MVKPLLSSTGLKEKTLQGFSWSLITQAGRYSTLVAVNIILARLLTPSEFGLMAMITVVTGFAEMVVEMGWGAAIIQDRDMGQEGLSSIFWINLFCGSIMAGLLALGAPLIAHFNHEPGLTPIVIIVSLAFLVNAPSIVPKTLFKRALDFKRLAIIEILSSVIAGSIAVFLALRGHGVWSLAAHFLAASVITTLSTWLLSEWRPRAVFRMSVLRAPLIFGVNLTAENILDYAARNLDNLLIGVFLGAGALGVYSRAYFIMTFPLLAVSWVPARVIFPLFGMIQDDKHRIKSIYLKVSRSVALITFPMMVGLLICAREFVAVVFGPQWAGMVTTLRILALVGMIQSVITLVGSLFLSQGKANLLLKLGISLKAIHMLAILIGLKWGITGVATGLLVASVLTAYPYILCGGGLVGLGWVEFLKSFGGISACTLLMAVAVWIVDLSLPMGSSDLLRLCVKTCSGILCYGGLLHTLSTDAWIQLKEALFGKFPLPVE